MICPQRAACLRLRWAAGAYRGSGFHPAPDAGIALDFGVCFGDEAVPPGILAVAAHWRLAVVEAKIPQNSGALRIGGANPRTAVQKTMRLVEIGGFGDVGGNEPVILMAFSDAIHLNGEQHGDAALCKRRARVSACEAPQLCP